MRRKKYIPPTAFNVGDQVDKVSGYKFPGTVQSVFWTRDSMLRYVVESQQIPGLLHIFNEAQLTNP